MADDIEQNGGDVGWWNCTLCTFKNSADKFKCEMCEMRRGTSTRKPRCSADTIVAQVVKQQEQIRQQTKVTKPAPKIRSATPLSSQSSAPSSQQRMTSASPDSSSQSSETHVRMLSTTPDLVSSPEPTTSAPPADHSQSPATTPDDDDDDEPIAPKDNPFKIRPIELNGNLIKYLPPTSTGRTGLIIDKKRFTQHSVTVDDVTITFTEFATRQSKYIRKSKKRSS